VVDLLRQILITKKTHLLQLQQFKDLAAHNHIHKLKKYTKGQFLQHNYKITINICQMNSLDRN